MSPRVSSKTPTFLVVLAMLGCAGCAHVPDAPPRVYRAVPTKADTAGPIVPPVYVRLVSDDAVTLQRATDDDWADVCVAPCNGYVPAFGRYRVSSRYRSQRGDPFTLPAPPGTWTVLAVDDSGKVWTRDSLQLEAARSRGSASQTILYVFSRK